MQKYTAEAKLKNLNYPDPTILQDPHSPDSHLMTVPFVSGATETDFVLGLYHFLVLVLSN